MCDKEGNTSKAHVAGISIPAIRISHCSSAMYSTGSHNVGCRNSGNLATDDESPIITGFTRLSRPHNLQPGVSYMQVDLIRPEARCHVGASHQPWIFLASYLA
jgi:hypothetical protein